MKKMIIKKSTLFFRSVILLGVVALGCMTACGGGSGSDTDGSTDPDTALEPEANTSDPAFLALFTVSSGETFVSSESGALTGVPAATYNGFDAVFMTYQSVAQAVAPCEDAILTSTCAFFKCEQDVALPLPAIRYVNANNVSIITEGKGRGYTGELVRDESAPAALGYRHHDLATPRMEAGDTATFTVDGANGLPSFDITTPALSKIDVLNPALLPALTSISREQPFTIQWDIAQGSGPGMAHLTLLQTGAATGKNIITQYVCDIDISTGEFTIPSDITNRFDAGTVSISIRPESKKRTVVGKGDSRTQVDINVFGDQFSYIGTITDPVLPPETP